MDADMLSMITSPPELSGIKRALFIQPHPDDNEIGAGGLMARLVSQGAEVWGLTVTDDRAVCPAEDIADGLTLRQRETLAAQQELGVRHAGFLGFEDKTDATVQEIAAAIVPVIRRMRPDAVLSVDPRLENECHRDHIKTGWAVRFAVMDAIWEHYPEGAAHEDVWQTPILGQYMTDKPNTVADISEFMDKKLRAVSCHESQVTGELLTLLELQAEWFGEKAGFRCGEAVKLLSFHQLHCFNLPVGTEI